MPFPVTLQARFASLCLSALLLAGGAAQAEPNWVQKDQATLRALDKITGRSSDIRVAIGEPVPFGSLEIHLQVCYQTPPEEPPESAAFLQVFGEKADASEGGTDEPPRLFSGWMFASSPGLSALEHPVYDVWVIECETPAIGG